MAKKRLITAEFVAAELAAGRRVVAAPRDTTVISPGAWSKAGELGVTFERGDAAVRIEQAETAQRWVDPSGVIAVRGSTVELAKFAAAGADKNVKLADVITGKDRSPMTAGLMSWGRLDSFAWTLDYDEVDYVLEGVLQIGIDGRIVEGRPGDVVFIPKGSKIIFGTPNRVRVFYVTYPADWAGAKPPIR